MSFIRPEVKEGLLRWREALIGGVILIVSLRFALFGLGPPKALGVVGIFVGFALIWEGVRRARLPWGKGGPGVVEVDERRITYFGPLGGGSVSVDELVRVTIRTTDLGPMVSDLFWDFTTREGETLTIPGDAENASALFDALAPLKGVDYEKAIAASGSTGHDAFVIWEGSPARLH